MNRLLLLIGFSIIVFASQAIWVTFSPASSLIAEELGVSKEAIGFLAVTYPAFFLALTIPSGILLDRGLKTWLLFGSITTGLAGIMRLVAFTSYEWLLVCQLLGAIGQPFLLNGFAPFASRVFPEKRSLVVSILSFSMYLGIIYALGTGYYIYKDFGLLGLVTPIALVSATGLALTLLGSGGWKPGGLSNTSSVLKGLKKVIFFRDLWLLGVILGLGVALFDNMSIWLEAVLSSIGLSDVAGLSVALALLLGLVGVVVVPTPIASANKRTLYIRLVTIVGLAFYTILAVIVTRETLLVFIPILGLLMLPAYPIIMEWITRFYPQEVHGSASGFIGLISRIFTVALAAIAVFFIANPSSYFSFLAVLTAAALATALGLPGDK